MVFERPAYRGLTTQTAGDRMVNWYPEGSDAGAQLLQRPGLATYGTPSGGTGRGLYVPSAAGGLYAVVGTTLYLVAQGGYSASSKGTVSGTTPATMADNGTYLLVVGGDGAGVLYNMITPSFAAISDTDFTAFAPTVCRYVDGYFVINGGPSSAYWGKWAVSDLYLSTTATGWSTLDRATAESNPDQLVTINTLNRQVWLMGKYGYELWYNAGDANFPFRRAGVGSAPIGCLSTWGTVATNNFLYWVGSLRDGRAMIWQADGYNPKRISSPMIERLLATATYSNLTSAIAATTTENGHTFVLFSVTGMASTICYDETTDQWCEWDSGASGGSVFPGKFHATGNTAGDSYWMSSTGAITTASSTTYADSGTAFLRKRSVTVPMGQHGSRSRHLRMRVTVESVGTGTPAIKLQSSETQGATFTDLGTNTLPANTYKATAEWWALGVAEEDRTYEISTSTSTRVNIVDSVLDAVELSA